MRIVLASRRRGARWSPAPGLLPVRVSQVWATRQWSLKRAPCWTGTVQSRVSRPARAGRHIIGVGRGPKPNGHEELRDQQRTLISQDREEHTRKTEKSARKKGGGKEGSEMTSARRHTHGHEILGIHTVSKGGLVWVRSLFTPFDARAHFILGTDCGRHGGRLQNPRT
jgi:hypothetical protein